MFAPRFFARTYYAGRYWPPAGDLEPTNDISATLSGSGSLTGTLDQPEGAETFGVSGSNVIMRFVATGMSFVTRVHRRTN